MKWTFVITAACLLLAVFGCSRSTAATDEELRNQVTKGAKVIDVRTAGEHAQKRVEGAINIPLDDLRDRIGQVVTNKAEVVLLHCRSGARSGTAQKILTRMGYTNAINMGSLERAEKIVKEAKTEKK